MPGKNKFIVDNLPFAQEVERKYGIPAEVAISQAGIESGWGQSIIGGNLFGIKGKGTQTTDAQTGLPIEQRSYSSPKESFEDYGKFITENPRYKEAFKYKNNPKQFAIEIAKAGYSERPEEYATALSTTIDNLGSMVNRQKEGVQLPNYTEQALLDAGYKPNEYLDKINADINKGGAYSFDAYKSYYNTIDKTMPPQQRAKKSFLESSEYGAPINQTLTSGWDDFTNSFGNSITRSLAHVKEAIAGAEKGLGITGDEEYAKQINRIQQAAAFKMLDVSEAAMKDPFSKTVDGNINWRGLGASIGSGLGGLTILAPSVIAGLVGSYASGGLAAPAFAGLTSAELGSLSLAGIFGGIDAYGTAFEEGKARGLTNDQASTLGAWIGTASAPLFMLPVHKLTGQFTKPLTATITKQAIDEIFAKGLTKEAFATTLPEFSGRIMQGIAGRAKNLGKNALSGAATLGGIMSLQSVLDTEAKKQYAAYSGTEDKFKDVIDKTAEQEFTEAWKSGAMGSILGGILALPTLAKSAAHSTMWGYVDENVNNEQKINSLKQYVSELGQVHGKTPAEIDGLVSDIDLMRQTSATYASHVADPEARFQVFSLLNDKNQTGIENTHADGEITKLTELNNPEFTAGDTEKWNQIKLMNDEKTKLANDYMTLIGDSKKRANMAPYAQKVGELNNKIKETLDQLYSTEPTDITEPKTETNAIQEQTTAESMLRDQGVQRESELQGVEQKDQPEKPAEEIQKEVNVVRDLLDVPGVLVNGAKGFLHLNDAGELFLIGEKGSETKIAEGKLAQEILDTDAADISSIVDSYDRDLLNQKQEFKTISDETKKEENQPEVPQGEQEGLLTNEEPTAVKQDEAPKLDIEVLFESKKEPDATDIERESATLEPDEQQLLTDLNKAMEDAAGAGAGKEQGITETTTTDGGPEGDRQTVSEGEQNKGAAKGKVRKSNKQVEGATEKVGYKTITEPIEMPDGDPGVNVIIEKPNGDRVSLGKMYPEDVEKEVAKKIKGYELQKTERKPAEQEAAVTSIEENIGRKVMFEQAGAERTGTIESIDKDGNYKVVDDNGTKYTVKPENATLQSTEPLPEGTTIIKDSDSKKQVEIKVKKKAKEANAKAEEKGITLSEQKADLVGKMESAVAILKEATEITPKLEAELNKYGIEVNRTEQRVVKTYDVFKKRNVEKIIEPTTQLQFQIKGDGEVRVGIETLPETLEMTKKEFPEGKYNVKVKTGVTGPGKSGLLKGTESIEDARSNLKEAVAALEKEKASTDSLSTADKKGRIKAAEGMVSLMQEVFDAAKKAFNEVAEDVEIPQRTKEEIKQLKPKEKGYYIYRQGTGFMRESKGKPIALEAEGDFFYTKSKGTFSISEGKSGALIGEGATLDEAVANSNKTLEQNKGKLDDTITRLVNDRGISPRYSDEARYQLQSETAGKPITPETAKVIDRVVKKAFPGIKTEFLSAEQFREKHGTDALGATNPDGTVDLNRGRITDQTQVHEFGHVWNTWAKKFAPELYKKGRELAAGETALIEKIKDKYPNLKGDMLLDEVMATAIGEKGAPLTTELKTGLIEWVSDLWNKISSYLKNKLGIADNRFENIENMGFNDFASTVAKQLLSGKEISPLTSAELAALETDGIARFQVEPSKPENETFKPPVGTFTLSMDSISPRMISSRFATDTRTILNGEKEVTAQHILDMENKLNKEVTSLTKNITKNPDGTENIPADAQDVIELRDSIGTEKNQKLLREIAEEAARVNEEHKFDAAALSKDARDLYNLIGNVMVQADTIRELQDKIVTDPYDRKVISNANEAQKLTVEPMAEFHEKKQEFKDKNKATKFIANTMEKFVRQTASIPLFMDSMSGGQNSGMWKSLQRGLQQGVGKEFRYIQESSNRMKPLYDKFKNGSTSISGSVLNRGMKYFGKPLAKVEGFNMREFFNEPMMPDVKMTEAEALSLFAMIDSRPEIRAAINEGKNIKWWLPEIKDERPETPYSINKKEWEILKTKFAPDKKLIEVTAQEVADYMYDKKAPIFKMFTGRGLPRVQGEGRYYIPMISYDGNGNIETYLKGNKFVNDLSSLKSRLGVGEGYLTPDFFQMMNGKIKNDARYAAFQTPLHNGDVMFDKYSKQYMVENGMQKDLEWWNKFKYHLNNPEEKISPVERALFKGFTMSAIGLNPFVDLKHLSTLPLATNVIRGKYIAQAVGELPRTYASMIKNLDTFTKDKDYAPVVQRMLKSDFANMRIYGNTSEMQAWADSGGKIRIKTENGDIDFTGKDTMSLLKTMETANGAVVWRAAEKMVDAEYPHLKPDTPEHFKKVEELYMDAIVDSQPSFDEIHKSHFSKGGFDKQRGTINRVLSLFSGQVTAQWNAMMSRSIKMINNPTPANKYMFAKSFVNAFVINALIVGSVDSFRQQALGKKPVQSDDYWKNIMREQVSGIPFYGKIIEEVMARQEKGIFAEGINYPTLETIDEATKALADAMDGKGEKALDEAMRFGSRVVGIPATPIRIIKKIAE